MRKTEVDSASYVCTKHSIQDVLPTKNTFKAGWINSDCTFKDSVSRFGLLYAVLCGFNSDLSPVMINQ